MKIYIEYYSYCILIKRIILRLLSISLITRMSDNDIFRVERTGSVGILVLRGFMRVIHDCSTTKSQV